MPSPGPGLGGSCEGPDREAGLGQRRGADRGRLHDPGLHMTLQVLDPGWASRVVDMGRPGWRSLGVPVGGAADRAALAIGNALLGNPPDAAALEVCLSGPRLR